MSGNPFELSESEIQEYFETGFIGPYEARGESEMDDIREHVDSLIQTEGPWDEADLHDMLLDGHTDGARIVDRHHDCEVIAELCLDPTITERMSSLYNENMILLFSQLFKKEPEDDTGDRSGTIGWHQDKGFFGLFPGVCPSVWIAIDETTTENGALEFLSGSHGQLLAHGQTNNDHWFDFELDDKDAQIDKEDIVTLEMDPGEFVIFSSTALHRSGPNLTDSRRMAMLLRSTVPYTSIQKPKRPEPIPIVQQGENYTGLYETISPPDSCQH